MSPALALPLFAASALLTFGAAGFFADRLDHLGPRLGLPEAAVGLLTAFAADTPEISSAVVALVSGRKDASLGVVLGSNVFNLAAMVGLSAVAAGAVTIGRRALLVEGSVSLLALAVTAGLIVGSLPAPVAFALFLAIAVPYLVLALRRPREPHPGAATTREPFGPGGQEPGHLESDALLRPLVLIVPAVVLIVVGSTGMVKAALALADRWHVSQTVTGLLVLAVLTSLPNAFTAVRLGLAGRGDALVTETLASNTINLMGGILVPALFVGVAERSGSVEVDLGWLLGMTLAALVALGAARGLRRRAGWLLIALYALFVAVHLAT